MEAPNDDLDAFLATDSPSGLTAGPRTRCTTCTEYPHLDGDIREFLRRKAAGELSLPVMSLASRKSLWTYLRSRGYKNGVSSLVRHIAECLGIDHKTGKPL